MVEGDVADQIEGESLARMIADNAHDIHVQLADPRAVEQVGQAMVEFGDEQQHLAALVTTAQPPVHAQAVREIFHACSELLEAACRAFEHQPHEEAAGCLIVILLRVEDVAAFAGEHARDRGHQTGPILARQREYEDVLHRCSPTPL